MAVQSGSANGPTRDIWSDIGNGIGSLFGIPQQQAAQTAQKQSAGQQALANQYGQQGAGIYGGLAQQGANQQGQYQNNYLNLLNQFGQLSGVGSPVNAAPVGGTTAQNFAYQNAQQAGQGQGGQAANPYQLDHNQQAMLNQSNAQIANASKSAQAQFVQHMASSGITDPRALQLGQEQLQEHFQALQQETEAKFYEQVKTDKLAALQQIIASMSQYGQQGIGEQEAAGSGFLGLASGAQAFSAQNQNVALQQQQNSQGAIGGLLNLGGFALGGGFGKAGAPATQGVGAVPAWQGPISLDQLSGIGNVALGI